MTASAQQSLDAETETLVAQVAPNITSNPYGDHESREGLLVAHALTGNGFDASEDGSGRGTPIVPVVAASLTRGAESSGKDGYAGRRQEDDTNIVVQPFVIMERGRDGSPVLEYRQDGTANAILTPNGGRGGLGVGAIAVQAGAMRENPNSGPDGVGVQADLAYTVESRAEVQAVAHEVRPINTMVGLRHEALGEGTGLGIGEVDDPAYTLSKAHSHAVQHGWAVRRLMPIECERLQGFPDGYTAIPRAKGKIAADGPRYKALGNSMAINCMRWIGERIAIVDALP